MKVTLIGATGHAGSRVLNELLSRGHFVTALVRDPSKLAPRANLKVDAGDIEDSGSIAAACQNSDALVSAYGPGPANPELLVSATRHLIQAARECHSPRVIYIGGAGTLEVAPGVTLIASGHLPQEWLGIAQAHAEALELMRHSGVNWTCISPSAFFEPGERTGKFRYETDTLLVSDDQRSHISFEDLAVALVDELEHPNYQRQRFTVGY
jgi:putative NADH-flavin reductase